MNTGNTVQGGLLGNIQPNRTFSSMSYNPVNPQYAPQPSNPIATSIATGQPTNGSITPLISSMNPQVSSPQIGQSSLSMLQKGGTIKSQTITGADGSTHSATYDTSGGKTASKGNAQNIPVTNPQGGMSYVSGTPDALPGAIASAGGTQQPPTSTYTPPTPNPTSMQGILGSLVNTATTPNPLLTQDIQKQQELASQIGPALATVTNTPGLLANQNARASNISQAYGQEMQGLGTNISALQALQGTQQSGLTSAGQLAQPTGAFPFVFNPVTGQFSAPGVGGTTGATGGTAGAPSLTYNPTQDAQTLAKQVMNRKISYNDALTALSYGSNSSSAPSQLSQAVIGLGGNPTDLQAQATGQAGVVGSIPALEGANTAARGISSTITSYLQQNPTLNSSPVVVGNAFQQWLQSGQLADPAYQTLFNDLSEYANTLAPVLGVGGDPTNMKTQIAQNFINAKAPGSSIATVLQNMGGLADDKIANLKSGAKGGGVVSTTPQTGGSSGATSATTGWASLGD